MLEKIKNYYRNSPKRIGGSWVAVHLLFFLVALGRLMYLGGSEVLATYPMQYVSLSFLMIAAFPTIFIANVVHNPIVVQPIILFVLYYGLFGAVCFSAKDTGSKKFLILSCLFTLLFMGNLFFGFYHLFYNELPFAW